MVAQNLAGWGAMIDVEGPDEVRAELARLGAELVERYAVSGTKQKRPDRPSPLLADRG
jgi:hypothetical protein